MNQLNITIGIISAVAGILVGIVTIKKNYRNDIQTECNTQTKLEVQLNYISRGVDDIRLDIKAQDNKINSIVERMARLEESCKSAHKRLNIIEKVED